MPHSSRRRIFHKLVLALLICFCLLVACSACSPLMFVASKRPLSLIRLFVCCRWFALFFIFVILFGKAHATELGTHHTATLLVCMKDGTLWSLAAQFSITSSPRVPRILSTLSFLYRYVATWFTDTTFVPHASCGCQFLNFMLLASLDVHPVSGSCPLRSFFLQVCFLFLIPFYILATQWFRSARASRVCDAINPSFVLLFVLQS